jgi:CRP-like cAMP-binding protein
LERALYLRSLVLFRDLGATELAACAQLTQELYVRRGELLYPEASPPRTLYLLVDGRVRLEQSGRFLRYLEAADDVGLVELLAGRPRGPRAVADTNALALTIDSAALLDLLEEHFSFFLHIRQALGREVARRQREVGSYHTLAAPRTTFNGHHQRTRPQGATTDLAEKLLMLRRSRLFRDVGLAVLAALTSDDREMRLAPGDTLWSRDGDPTFLALILDGTVTCTPEDERHAFRAQRGALLGADATFGGVPYVYTAVADSPVVATCIDTQLLVDMAEDHFDLASRMLAHCAAELLRLQEVEIDAQRRPEPHGGDAAAPVDGASDMEARP